MILADENIVAAVGARLRSDGFDVLWMAEAAPSTPDADVLALAVEGGRVLLTDDKDFGELVIREGRPHRGVVLLRFPGLPPSERAELVSRVLAAPAEAVVDAFTVVERDGRVRVRKLAGR